MAITAARVGRTYESADDRSLPVGFLWWAHITITMCFVATYVFGVLRPYMTTMRNGAVVLGVIWIVVAMTRRKVQVRLCFPIAALLLLQVWGALGTTFASATFG